MKKKRFKELKANLEEARDVTISSERKKEDSDIPKIVDRFDDWVCQQRVAIDEFEDFMVRFSEELEKRYLSDEWHVPSGEASASTPCWYKWPSWDWWELETVEHFRWMCGLSKGDDDPPPIAVLVKEGQGPPSADYVPGIKQE